MCVRLAHRTFHGLLELLALQGAERANERSVLCLKGCKERVAHCESVSLVWEPRSCSILLLQRGRESELFPATGTGSRGRRGQARQPALPGEL